MKFDLAMISGPKSEEDKPTGAITSHTERTLRQVACNVDRGLTLSYWRRQMCKAGNRLLEAARVFNDLHNDVEKAGLPDKWVWDEVKFMRMGKRRPGTKLGLVVRVGRYQAQVRLIE